MKVSVKKELGAEFDALIVPLSEESVSGQAALELPGLPEMMKEAVLSAVKAGKPGKECGAVYAAELYEKETEKFRKLVLVQLGDGTATNREVFLALAKAFKCCKESKPAVTAVFMDAAGELLSSHERIQKLFELPYLVSYQFNAYKSVPVENGMKEAVMVTEKEGMEDIAREAKHVAESTMLARDLVNHPSMYMTPEKLAEEAAAVAKETGLEIQVYDKKEMEDMKMGAFLSVAQGAVDEPRLIVLRYHGGKEGEAPVALVGKGIMFDSGGYSLKSKMDTMHDDMGGAAAVIGAIRAIALEKLPVNVIAVAAACENMISGDAYVPGDILFSMNGKTIEMLNADAEGRLTLADAITYAIRKEGAGAIIDIATLTGAAKGAVGGKSAAVLANDDELYAEVEAASEASCEKIWRLPADKELFAAIRSDVADIKNSSPGNPMGGGSIVAGLFIQEFVEEKPWVHVDMAPVNWLPEGNSYCIHGASGYGVSLLYETVKVLGK